MLPWIIAAVIVGWFVIATGAGILLGTAIKLADIAEGIRSR